MEGDNFQELSLVDPLLEGVSLLLVRASLNIANNYILRDIITYVNIL